MSKSTTEWNSHSSGDLRTKCLSSGLVGRPGEGSTFGTEALISPAHQENTCCAFCTACEEDWPSHLLIPKDRKKHANSSMSTAWTATEQLWSAKLEIIPRWQKNTLALRDLQSAWHLFGVAKLFVGHYSLRIQRLYSFFWSGIEVVQTSVVVDGLVQGSPSLVFNNAAFWSVTRRLPLFSSFPAPSLTSHHKASLLPEICLEQNIGFVVWLQWEATMGGSPLNS